MMRSPRILVVEDEGLVALDICKQLGAMGYDNVCNAGSAEKALALAENDPPDLALLDIRIDGSMDGIELGRRLRESCDTPVIYLTAFTDSETLERAKRTEPYGYVVKPIEGRELRSSIEVALFKHQEESARQRAESRAREIERQLFQTQRMDSLGKLTAGIAHELNNMLFAAMGNMNLLRADEKLSRASSERLDRALEACKRSADMIKQLLGFSRQGMYQPEVVNIRSSLHEALNFLGKVTEEDLKLSFTGANEDLPVTVDRSQFQQVITNLLLNAKQAMPKGGTVEFSLGRAYVESAHLHNPEAEPGEYVTLTVRDTGAGIDKKLLDRVFDPFFSTKPRGEGTGLGLAVVYGIMQRHGGWASIDSIPGEGTSVNLFFPLAQHCARPERSEPTSGAQRRLLTGSGRVMVLDDEEVIVEVIAGYLQECGFSPIGFCDPREALRWYETRANEVDVVILDMRMPEMDGAACYYEIKRLNRNAQILLCSGYARDETVDELLRHGAAGFFQKPCDFDQLAERVQQLVGCPAADSDA